TIANAVSMNAGSSGITFSGGSNLTFQGSTWAMAASGQTYNVASSSTATINDVISGGGSGGIIKTGSGTLVIGGSSANTFTGGLTISGGQVTLQKTAGTNAIGSGNIVINSGGTLLLANSNQLPSGTNMVLNGGVFNTGGQNQALGTLTLSSTSNIDMGSGANIISFADSSGASWSSNPILNIVNWDGSLTGGGSSQLIFGSAASGLTANQIAQIRFYNPAGLSPGTYSAQILSTGELIPDAAPEPATTVAGLLMGLIAVFWEIKRHKKKRIATSPCPN
ncbi:MAG TPA: hypothetical protein PLV25_06555, partial [Opitutales bacterium]|nr:hypothetical protein [Opitutales bacterium]